MRITITTLVEYDAQTDLAVPDDGYAYLYFDVDAIRR